MSRIARPLWLLIAILAVIALMACAPAAQPTAAPAQPTSAPAQPTSAPAQPTAAPEQPTQAPAPTEAPQPTQAPAVGSAQDTIVWVRNIDDVVSMDPAEAYEFSGWLAVHSMYDTLVKFEGKDLTNLKPGLADKWDVKDAGDHWELTFTLKDGVKFASGNPLTSADVVYSFQRAIRLNKSPAFLYTETGGLKEDSITAPDAKTVVLKMPKTSSPAEFLNVLTAPPLSIVDSVEVKKHETTVDGKSDDGNTWLKDHSAGSGPYMLDHWTKDVEYLLKANPNAAVQPKTPQILLQHMPEAANQQSVLEKGDADIAQDLTPEQITALQSNKDIKTLKAGNLQLFYIGMNAGMKPLDDNRVREAIRYAIDYDAIANELLSGNVQIMQTIIPNGLLGANTDIIFKRDVEKAKSLMKEAGVDSFQIDLLTLTGNQGLVPMADLAAKIQADLADIGITVNVKQQAAAELLATYRASKAPMVMLFWGPDYPDPNTNATPFSDINAGSIAKRNNWKDDKAIQMAAAAKLESDTAKRVADYKELTDYVAHNGPYAVLFQPQNLFALRANVTGFDWNPMGYADLWTIGK
jgi:peptide/nickel transport system substrate-binding protein